MSIKNIAKVSASALVLSAIAIPSANAATNPDSVHSPMNTNGRTQVSVDHTYTGGHVGTPNENESRYSLSLTKLLIADYVFEHGSTADKAQASQMIEYSDDNIATQLYSKYPQSVQSKANQYNMNSAVPASNWGNWKFSSADWSRYMSAKHREDPTATGPLLSSMRNTSNTAADGYNQRYGVALLPGAQGWKSGWSDDRTSYHASVGFGGGWSVAVQTNGGKESLNQDLTQALNSGSASSGDWLDTTNYPARAVAQSGIDSTKQWVDNNVGTVDQPTANTINTGIDNASTPVINMVPEYIPMPGAVANILPQP